MPAVSNFSVMTGQNGLSGPQASYDAPLPGTRGAFSGRQLTLGARLKQIDAELDLMDPIRLGPMVHDHKMMSLIAEKDRILSEMTVRNLAGRDAEKSNEIEKAIRLYEENVKDEADTPFPYERLAIIYRKQKRYEDEIRVVEAYTRSYGPSEWTNRIEKARELQKRANETKAIHDSAGERHGMISI